MDKKGKLDEEKTSGQKVAAMPWSEIQADKRFHKTFLNQDKDIEFLLEHSTEQIQGLIHELQDSTERLNPLN